MIIEYTDPKNGTVHAWDWDPDKILMSEEKALKKVAEVEWSAIRLGLVADNREVVHACAWVMLKRQQPSLRFSHFDPPRGAIRSLFTAADVEEIREDIDRKYTDEDEHAQAMAELEEMLQDRRRGPDLLDDVEAEDEGPKGPAAAVKPRGRRTSTGSVSSGGSGSPTS